MFEVIAEADSVCFVLNTEHPTQLVHTTRITTEAAAKSQGKISR
jgi:hypothetical protein